jgi:uracil phosphoribosyltransferase
VTHGEVSRLIAKLRDERTQREEFVYYIQRAYELLFNMAYCGPNTARRNYLVVKTPVNFPVQNYAVHKIPHIDEDISDTVMCVMLRGSLLPSMIMSKEIQEYSSGGYVTPFALFKVSRNDKRREDNMEYILDLDRSYIDLASLDGRQLIFADPMNATGGSLVTIIKYLRDQGVRPKSIRFFNAISALKGALRIARRRGRASAQHHSAHRRLRNQHCLALQVAGAQDRGDGPRAARLTCCRGQQWQSRLSCCPRVYRRPSAALWPRNTTTWATPTSPPARRRGLCRCSSSRSGPIPRCWRRTTT